MTSVIAGVGHISPLEHPDLAVAWGFLNTETKETLLLVAYLFLVLEFFFYFFFILKLHSVKTTQQTMS